MGKAGLSYVYFTFHLPRIAARRFTMSFPYTPNLQDSKIESLRTQQEYLNLLRVRQLHWMSSADDPQIRHVHQEIAELIETITDRYSRLINALGQPGDKE
jgi:hypothetical protein